MDRRRLFHVGGVASAGVLLGSARDRVAAGSDRSYVVSWWDGHDVDAIHSTHDTALAAIHALPSVPQALMVGDPGPHGLPCIRVGPFVRVIDERAWVPYLPVGLEERVSPQEFSGLSVFSSPGGGRRVHTLTLCTDNDDLLAAFADHLADKLAQEFIEHEKQRA